MMTKKKRKPVDWRIVCVAIIGLTIIELAALEHGINGWLLRIVLVIIAGLAGYVIPSPIKFK